MENKDQMIPVRIGTVNDKVQAQMVVDMLKEQGIFAFSEVLATTEFRDSYRGYGTGGEAIFVDKLDVDAAKELAGDFFIENSEPAETKGKMTIARISAIVILIVFAIILIYSFIDSIGVL